MSYALVQGADRQGIMSGNSSDFDEVAQAKRSVSGDFLWFRKGGKSYLIQDPAALAKMNEAYAPVKRLSAEMDVYGKEMDVHGKQMDALGKEMGLALIFNKFESGLVYASEAVEITDTVIQRFNAAAGTPAAAPVKK